MGNILRFPGTYDDFMEVVESPAFLIVLIFKNFKPQQCLVLPVWPRTHGSDSTTVCYFAKWTQYQNAFQILYLGTQRLAQLSDLIRQVSLGREWWLRQKLTTVKVQRSVIGGAQPQVGHLCPAPITQG